MTYDSDERSVSSNRPIDLYTIVTPTTTYRITSHVVDVVYGGNTFSALTMSRGNQLLQQDQTGKELIVYLPISHPLIQRYAADGVPEHGVVVTLQRLQTVSSVAAQQWTGIGQSITVDGHIAMMRVPDITDDAFKISLPAIGAQRTCNHILFDSGCAPNPGTDGPAQASFTLSTTIVAQIITANSITILLSSIGANPDQWAQFGQLVHTASQQRRMVLDQTGATLTLQTELVGINPGDAVSLIAGCAHDMNTCVTKFSNRANFGGHPYMGVLNPYIPNGLGTITQT